MAQRGLPLRPGHEIVGRVAQVGAEVSRVRPGDAVAVGCLVDSCRACDRCRAGLEQFCRAGAEPDAMKRHAGTDAARSAVPGEHRRAAPAGSPRSRRGRRRWCTAASASSSRSAIIRPGPIARRLTTEADVYAGCSDLAALEDGSFVCAYEYGGRNDITSHCDASVVVARFTLADLTGPSPQP